MGSIDSGRHYRQRRLSTRELPSIDIRDIDYLHLPSGSWTRGPQEILGAPIYIKEKGNELSIGIRESNFVHTIGNAAMTWSPRNYGGAQPYFLCPAHDCARRAAILYISGKQIACRACSNLSYESQHENKYIRLLRRASKLRNKIGATPQLLSSLPQRPKHMHKATYDHVTFMILSIEVNAIHEMKAHMQGYWGTKLQHLDQMAKGTT